MDSDYKIALDKLMASEISSQMVDHLVYQTEKVITVVSDENAKLNKRLPTLRKFILRLVDYTNVYTETLLMTLCYLHRVQKKLPSHATGLPSTRHRIFLSCLILSAKNHNDSSPLNKHWTKYTDGLFTLQDVNLMERQLLSLLDWDLNIGEDEVISIMKPLLDPIVLRVPIPSLSSSSATLSSALSNSTTSLSTKLYNLKRNESVLSNISSSSTLVNPLSQQDLNKPLREYKIVNNVKESSSVLKRSGKSWSLGNMMRQYGLA